jgi:hypothetical protein
MNESFFKVPLDDRQYAKTDEFSFVLKPSAIQGVGAFATHGICRGAHLQLFPQGATRTFSKEQMENDPRLKRFCQVYGVDADGGTYVAPHFGCMSIGWYLNHSETPNAHHDEDYEYFASRDIAADEEITIDYRKL